MFSLSNVCNYKSFAFYETFLTFVKKALLPGCGLRFRWTGYYLLPSGSFCGPKEQSWWKFSSTSAKGCLSRSRINCWLRGGSITRPMWFIYQEIADWRPVPLAIIKSSSLQLSSSLLKASSTSSFDSSMSWSDFWMLQSWVYEPLPLFLAKVISFLEIFIIFSLCFELGFRAGKVSLTFWARSLSLGVPMSSWTVSGY